MMDDQQAGDRDQDRAPLTDSQVQQVWWESMTVEQQEAYEDRLAHERAEVEVYGHVLSDDQRDAILCGDEDRGLDDLGERLTQACKSELGFLEHVFVNTQPSKDHLPTPPVYFDGLPKAA